MKDALTLKNLLVASPGSKHIPAQAGFQGQIWTTTDQGDATIGVFVQMWVSLHKRSELLET